MNQEMSLRTPDPLSAFREGLGTRLPRTQTLTRNAFRVWAWERGYGLTAKL